MPSIYQLKTRFQNLLRPFLRLLAGLGITANGITLLALAASLGYGLWLSAIPHARLPWLLLPLFLLLRMALNAIDGMLAREYGQQSRLGAILNESGDVVSDAALYLPFALLTSMPYWVVLAVLMALLTEFIGVLGPMLGSPRRYDGPMGKSDRAFVYGAYGFLIGLQPQAVAWCGGLFAATSALMVFTCINRARAMLQEEAHG